MEVKVLTPRHFINEALHIPIISPTCIPVVGFLNIAHGSIKISCTVRSQHADCMTGSAFKLQASLFGYNCKLRE
jgi:hypothetical protein